MGHSVFLTGAAGTGKTFVEFFFTAFFTLLLVLNRLKIISIK
jgi:hypothetical protein